MNLTVGAGDEANADERPEREVVYTHQGVQARSCRVIRGGHSFTLKFASH